MPPEFTKMSIGERLLFLVAEEQVGGRASITGFARLADIPYRTFQNYVRGEREPSTAALIKLHTNANVNLNWLLTGQGVPWGNVVEDQKFEKLMLLFWRDIIQYIADHDTCLFTDEEKTELTQHILSKNYLGLGDRMLKLIESGEVEGFDEIEKAMAQAVREDRGGDKG